MNRRIGALAFTCVLVISTLSVFAASQLKSDSKSQTVRFDEEFCKIVSRNPLITVCIGGDPGQPSLNERSGRIVNREINKLLAKYKSKSIASESTLKLSLNCGPMPNMDMSNMTAYAAWMTCMAAPTLPPPPIVVEPPSACTPEDWVPAQCGGAATYCDAYPSDLHCVCTYENWVPALCGGAPTYCAAYPSDPICMEEDH